MYDVVKGLCRCQRMPPTAINLALCNAVNYDVYFIIQATGHDLLESVVESDGVGDVEARLVFRRRLPDAAEVGVAVGHDAAVLVVDLDARAGADRLESDHKELDLKFLPAV